MFLFLSVSLCFSSPRDYRSRGADVVVCLVTTGPSIFRTLSVSGSCSESKLVRNSLEIGSRFVYNIEKRTDQYKTERAGERESEREREVTRWLHEERGTAEREVHLFH